MPSKQKRFDKFIDDLIALDLPKVLPRVWIGQYYPTFDPPFKVWFKMRITDFPDYPAKLGQKLVQEKALHDFIVQSEFAHLFYPNPINN